MSDWNGASDIYEFQFATDSTAHISQDSVRGPGAGASDAPSLSSDGAHAAFESLSPNFSADTNLVEDIFLHEWINVVGDLVSEQPAGARPSGSAEEQPLPRHCELKKPSVDGTPSSVTPSAGFTGAEYSFSAAASGGSDCKVEMLTEPPGGPEEPCGPYPQDPGPSQEHHIATNKNDVSSQRGGPWTREFRKIFDGASVGLNDKVNRVHIRAQARSFGGVPSQGL